MKIIIITVRLSSPPRQDCSLSNFEIDAEVKVELIIEENSDFSNIRSTVIDGDSVSSIDKQV